MSKKHKQRKQAEAAENGEPVDSSEEILEIQPNINVIPIPKKNKRKISGMQEASQVNVEDAQAAGTKTVFRGVLAGDKVIVEEDYEKALEYYNRGCFGEIHGVKRCRLELALPEALYLLERERILVKHGRSEALTFEEFVRVANRASKNFWTRYRVYRELRTRGYILKTALKFGADFLVYNRGVKPGEGHSKWVLFCADENGGITWRGFSAMNRVAHSTKKKLMVGIVDERGAVTYYSVSWTKP